jgi:hypothetical protein
MTQYRSPRGAPRAALGPGPVAVGAVLLARDGEGFRAAAGRLDELDLDADLQIAARLRSAAPAAAEQVAEDAAEQVLEDVARVEVLRLETVEPGVAVAVVARPLVGVAQHLERLGRLLELLRRDLVADVAVGVMLEGQLAVRLLDVLVAHVPGDAEDFVIVALVAGHYVLIAKPLAA